MNWKLNLGKIDGEFCHLEVDDDNLLIDSGNFDFPMCLDKHELKDFIDGLKEAYKVLTKG